MATISQINIDDYHYNFIDVKSRNILTEFYAGGKIILDAVDYSSIKNSAIEIYTPNPTRTIGEKLIGMVDRVGESRSYINWGESLVGTDETQSFILGTGRKTSNSTTAYNYLTLDLDSNANPIIDVSNQRAWRRALGFGDNINTTTISQIITPGPNITIVDAHYVERANVAMLYLHFKCNVAISVPNHGNIIDVNIGTIVEGKRPFMHAEACSNGDEGGAAWYDINPNTGAIAFCAIEGMSTTRTIAANTQFNLAATYFVR